MGTRRTKSQTAISKPPATFPLVIKPHAYDPSGLGTCLFCGQKPINRLHISPHKFVINYSSKLEKCMCGYKYEHSIHTKEVS